MTAHVITTIGLFVTAGILWFVAWQIKKQRSLMNEKAQARLSDIIKA